MLQTRCYTLPRYDDREKAVIASDEAGQINDYEAVLVDSIGAQIW